MRRHAALLVSGLLACAVLALALAELNSGGPESRQARPATPSEPTVSQQPSTSTVTGTLLRERHSVRCLPNSLTVHTLSGAPRASMARANSRAIAAPRLKPVMNTRSPGL